MTGYGKLSSLPGEAVWAALRSGLAGELLLPEETGYDTARRTADTRHDAEYPAAVVRCATESDVGEALRFAGLHGLRVHTRAGGHCVAGFSTGPGLVVDVSPLDTVTVDGDQAGCGAGASTGALADALDAEGRAVPMGLCPTAGVAGLTLGGGMGTTGRRYGYTLDSLTSARVVLADGSAVDCDAARHPDLFWALRGAGPLVPGVVTSLGFRTRPELPVTDFLLGWPPGCRARVLSAWQEWGPHAPTGLSSRAAVTAGEPWDGLQPAAVGGSWLGAREDLEHHLAALVAAVGRDPDTSITASHGQRASLRFWGGEAGRRISPVLRRHDFFQRNLPGSTVRELIAVLERDLRPGESRNCDFEALGGAYNRVPGQATAMAHRSHLFGMLAQFGPVRGERHRRATVAALDGVHTLVRPWASGAAYQNYAEVDRPDWAHTYYGSNYPRLAAIRERYDPEEVFRAPFAPGARALSAGATGPAAERASPLPNAPAPSAPSAPSAGQQPVTAAGRGTTVPSTGAEGRLP